jgi:hypothetical protein
MNAPAPKEFIMIDHRVSEEIVDYLAALKASNTEEAKKLRFHNLLTRLFSDSAASRALVDQMAAGGEKTIFTFLAKARRKPATPTLRTATSSSSGKKTWPRLDAMRKTSWLNTWPANGTAVNVTTSC